MLFPLKPICEKKNVRKDGTSIIYIQYCYSSERRTNLNTQIAIPPSFWNKKKECIAKDLPKIYGDAAHLNDELERLLQKQEISDKGTFVKKTFYPSLNINELERPDKVTAVVEKAKITPSKDFFGQINDYIESKENKVSKGMIKIYNQMSERLRGYEAYRRKSITFNCIDYNFYEGFVDYLTYVYEQRRRKGIIKGLKLSTIGQTIKQFRIFIKDRVRRKVILPIDLTDFKILDEESDAVYLSMEEISKIYNADLSKQTYLIPYRDLLVFACLTGLRFSDFSTLTTLSFRNDMLYKKQDKSNHWVIIPLRKEAKEIFKAHFLERLPDLTNPEFNRHIKTVVKLAGICEMIEFSHKKGNQTIKEVRSKYAWITFHTGRRSFCTNEFLAGTPVKLIMKISGHKSEKDFYKYIRITPMEAAQKMQELWLERSDMVALSNPLRQVS